MHTASRLLAAAAILIAPAALRAQGTVSAQGFGYPPGQLSTQALGSGGATAEFDPLSPLNPAALLGAPTTQLTVQYEPEVRTTKLGDVSTESTVNRFPLIGVASRVGGRLGLGLSVSTFLDRSWATQFSGTVDGTSVTYRETFESRGAINDVRAAAAWRLGPRLVVGGAAHMYTGENVLDVGRVYDDSAYVMFRQSSRLDYFGSALSGGLVISPSRTMSVALSGRLGGALRARRNDVTIAEGDVPARAAASLRYTGLPGAVIAARSEWTGWSSMDALGSDDLDARDGWDLGLGVEVQGPSIAGNTIPLRLGGRVRDLPFAADGAVPRETSFAGGFTVPFARGRVLFDFGVQRASRTAGDAEETSWTYSTGLVVRP
ncbi:MAG TPA: hypothetical protein VFY16_12445 [Gemmatimonadaceae bacterium]|nr:hypothetical protein [Gemmatimonadaceae bacterium]